MGYMHLDVARADGVATVWLNRPEKLNALSEDMWADLPSAIGELDDDEDVRVIVLAGRGPSFTVGIDLGMLASLQPSTETSAARVNLDLYRQIKRLQQTAGCLADTAKPVIASIHGHCLGAGMDLITACDIRLATVDSVFSVRETRMGLVADIGTLQRLPSIVGSGVTTEMALTGADYSADWALAKGLVTSIHDGVESLQTATAELAQQIASNSPLVTHGVKRVLQANDGRTLDQALDYVAQWNSSFLLSDDLMEAMSAFMDKREPDFRGT